MISPTREVRWPNGNRLDAEQYLKDFNHELARLAGSFLKFERAQHFVEPGNPSWERFAAGDWAGALTAIDAQLKPGSAGYFEQMRRRGVESLRLRVVAFPITPYVQWELHVLRAMADLGEKVRVLTQDAFLRLCKGELCTYPELNFMDSSTMYEVLYDASGEHYAAIKYSDSELVRDARGRVDVLFHAGQALEPFFEEVLAPLPPPRSRP